MISYSRYSLFLRSVATVGAGVLFMFFATMPVVIAVEMKPLPFRELARGDVRMLTDQGKIFLSEKIRSGAYSVKVMNISWETDRRRLKKPTIYETMYEGHRFLFVLAGNYYPIVVEVPHDKNEKRFNALMIPGVDWTEFLNKDPRHQIDTSQFVAPRHYVLHYSASGMMFRIGLNDYLIAEERVERGSAQGDVPVNIAVKAGPGNLLRVQNRLLSDDGELSLVLYDYYDNSREVLNIKMDGNNHEAVKEFEIPTGRPIPAQTSIFELEAWKTLP